MPYIDENDKPVLLAYNETTGLPETVYVDPITNAVLCFGVTDEGGTFTDLNNAKIDDNENATMLGYNETTGLIEALRCGSSGELLITT